MTDVLLAWRNIWRNPRRSILTMLAIIFATTLLVFMLSFQFGAYDDMIDSSVRLSTGHLQVQQFGYQDRPAVRKVVENPEKIKQKLIFIDGVEAVSFRSESFVLLNAEKRSKGLMVTGVVAEDEMRLSSLPDQVVRGSYLAETDSGVGVIGALAARHLKLDVGDECVFLGQGRDGSVAATALRIKGIFKTGIEQYDRAAMQIPLADFDTIFSMAGSVHRIMITVDQLSEAPRIANLARALPETQGLAVLTWEELNPGLKQSIELDLISGIVMYLILVVVVAFSILNTFFMAIFERKKEFGVLMSIGMKPRRLVKLMMMESMSMTLTGLIIGVALGIGCTMLGSVYGISMGDSGEFMAQYGIPDRLYPTLSWASVLIGPALIWVVTFITALIPVIRIPRLHPVEAMRS
jgi:ABC-type lipoprotein release transport system permease subunit